ncbi:MAG: methionyl-tRNA formyltransferase [Lysobacterales bacterium]
MNIVFAGTPEFALPALKALTDSEHQISAVYTQPDRPSGRGRKLTASPIKAFALDQCPSADIRQPLSLRGEDAAELLADLKPDLMVVAAYGLILPRSILSVPTMGCWNIHASLLPRWRGAAPIARAVLAGDSQTGVCIMQMAAGLDTGDVLSRAATPIDLNDTAGDVHDRLATMGAELLMQTLESRHTLRPQPQNDAEATYASKLEKNEANLDFSNSAVEIERRIRAFNPWPVARFKFNGQWLRVWAGEAIDGVTDTPGTVVASGAEGIDLATGEGVLRITKIQRPGGKALPVAAFLNAVEMPVGARLELSETGKSPE